MAKRIDIRGVILDASWDFDWLDSYIQKGIFTPESRVRAQLAEAEKAGEDVEIYISSYGGSVIAGNEMLAAIQSFKGNKSIVIGSFAASMAANIALQAGCEVKCHTNSLFLFHGASCVTFGGKGVHADSSDWLGKINKPIQERLVALGVPEDRVEQGFQDERELTFDAKEAKQLGIVSEIIGEVSEPSAKVDKAEMEEILSSGLPVEGIAAVMTVAIDEGGTQEGTEEGSGEGQTGTDGQEETPEARAGRLEAALIQARAETEQAKAEVKAVQSACDKRVSAIQAKLDSTTAEFNAFKVEAEKSATEANEKISTLTAERDAAKDAHAKLVGGVLGGQDESEANMTWPELVARYGQAEAMKRFPAKAEEFRKSVTYRK